MSVLASLALYASLNGADAASGLGKREANPVVREVGLAPMKVLSTAALTLGDRSIKSKKGRLIYRLAVVAGYSLVVAHNLRTR